MRGRIVNLENLRYFQLLYYHRSFSAAAEAVPMTKQGLRKSIHSLESQLKTKLYLGTQEGIKITESGERLYQFFNEVDPAYRCLVSDLVRIDSDNSLAVSLGFSFGNFSIFQKPITDYIDTNLEPSIVTTSLPEKILVRELEAGLFDLAVTWGKSDSPYLEYHHIAEISFYVVLNKNNPLSSKSEFLLYDLKEESLISLGSFHKLHNLLEDACLQAGFTPRFRYCTCELPVIQTYLDQNAGVGFSLPPDLRFFSHDTLVTAPLLDFKLPIGISYRKGHNLIPSETEIIDILSDALLSQ